MKVNDAHSALRSAYQDWEGFLSNPRFVRRSSTISWENYRPKEFTGILTASFVSDLAEYGQYSFQVTQDGSIFQLYYEYDHRGHTLKKASLAFLFSGNNYLEDNSRELLDEMLVPTPDIDVGWLRIDYSASNDDDGGLSHPRCHMHLSHFPNTRLLVDRVPNPKQFIEFVVSICYPDIYGEKRLDKTGSHADKAKMCNINSPLCPDLGMAELCNYASHLHIPTAIVAPMQVAGRHRR